MLAALEQKVRERNSCYIPGLVNLGDGSRQQVKPSSADDRADFDGGPNLSTSAENGGGVDVGPQISSPEESDNDELNLTVKEQKVDEQDDSVNSSGVEEKEPKSKLGAARKKRRSQLDLLGVCSNQLFNGLGLRSGKVRVGSDAPVVEEDHVQEEEVEDGYNFEDDEETEY